MRLQKNQPAGSNLIANRLTRPQARTGRTRQRCFSPQLIGLEQKTLLSAVPTVLNVTSSSLVSTYGNQLVLSASLTTSPAQTVKPSGGTVTFYDAVNGQTWTTLGTVPVANGQAVLTTTALSAGQNQITAAYSGDGTNFAASSFPADPYPLIKTVAGGALPSGPALQVGISPRDVVADAAGNLFFTSLNEVLEYHVDTQTISVVAGNGTVGFSGDGGPATASGLYGPEGLAINGSGDLFIGDSCRIRKIDARTGIITTIAGTGNYGNQGDGGPATDALLAYPGALAFDRNGNLFFLDGDNHSVREIEAVTGIIKTVAGNKTPGYSGDGGPATDAQIGGYGGLVVNESGDLFIADGNHDVVRKVDVGTGIITTVAGNGTQGFSGDGGNASNAQLNSPGALAIDSVGNLLIADSGNHRVRKLDVGSGLISTVAGNGVYDQPGDGHNATDASLEYPDGLTLDSRGNLYISDHDANVIRKVDVTTGVISTIAGKGVSGRTGDGGSATATELFYPAGVSCNSTGDLYVADLGHYSIRKVSARTGVISTVAGNGKQRVAGDGGPASAASFMYPEYLTVDAANNLYIAEYHTGTVRKVDAATGLISVVAGNGTSGYSGDDGPATAASLEYLYGIATDAAGNLFITDSGNNVIREVFASTGIIKTIAGNKTAGYSGDGGTATGAQLNQPTEIAVDADGNLYIADAANNAIRRVDAATHIITTFAGNGTYGGPSGDGQLATETSLSLQYSYPAITIDPNRDVWFVDDRCSVRKVDSRTGIITTPVNTTATYGFAGDGGPASLSQLSNVRGLAFDAVGNVFISDANNMRVREAFVSSLQINVAKAALTLVALPVTMAYGETVPHLPYTFKGLVNGDNDVSVNGGPILSTTATNASPLGRYPVTLNSLGTLAAANYTFSTSAFEGSSVQITRGLAQVNLLDASTSYDFGKTIQVRAVVSPGQSNLAKPTGTVRFQADKQDLGIVPLNDAGVATLNTKALAVGTHVVTAIYSGDGNYLSSSPDTEKYELTLVAGASEAAGPELNFSISPKEIAVDHAGNIYFIRYSQVLEYVRQTQMVHVVAGTNENYGDISDGRPATAVSLSYPNALAVDFSGNLYIADHDYHFIRKVHANTGIITTVAGTDNWVSGGAYYSGDGGPATAASISVSRIGFDAAGNLYIADSEHDVIRVINAQTGIISTIAGNGFQGYTGDGGQAKYANLNITNFTVDEAGNLFVSDSAARVIRKVDHATGIISTIAGNGNTVSTGDGGPAVVAGLSDPQSITVDRLGNVYFFDTTDNRIRMINAATGNITTMAGGTSTADPGDGGPALLASLGTDCNIEVDHAGNLLIADSWNHSIRRIDATTRQINVLVKENAIKVAGGKGPATSSLLGDIQRLCVDAAGNLYISDAENAIIQKVDGATNSISTVVGNGVSGYSGDGGPASDASLAEPDCLAIDSQGNLFISDFGNNRVRRVDFQTGIITTVAGNGTRGYSGDTSAATAAELTISAIALDSAGNLFIADERNNVIRKVFRATGVIKTIAGNGSSGSTGDGGPASLAQLDTPRSIATDNAGNLYVSSGSGSSRIRKIDASTGVITSVDVSTYSPGGMALDTNGNLYFHSFYGIQKVSLSTGKSTTVEHDYLNPLGTWQPYFWRNAPLTVNNSGIFLASRANQIYKIRTVGLEIEVTTPPAVSVKSAAITAISSGSNKTTNVVVVQFSGLLNAKDAATASVYGLRTVATKKTKAKTIAVSKAVYDSASQTVKLYTKSKLTPGTPYQLTIQQGKLHDTLKRPLNLKKTGTFQVKFS